MSHRGRMNRQRDRGKGNGNHESLRFYRSIRNGRDYRADRFWGGAIMSRYSKADREEAISRLRSTMPKGSTVYTSLAHVSKSGMSRSIRAFLMVENEPLEVTYWVARALGDSIDSKRGGVKVTGCGMDMGYDLVHRLSYTLHGMDAHDAEGHERSGYTLKQRWL